MSLSLAALASLALAAPAAAQDGGWDLEQADGRVVASVTFESGAGIAVQCAGGRLDVALLGLPPTPRRLRDVHARRLETGFDTAALDDSSWRTEPGSDSALSWSPARRARSLRQGGVFFVRTDEATTEGPARRLELPLPSDASSLDQVLAACGTPTSDERDSRLSVDDILTEEMWRRSRMFEMPSMQPDELHQVEVSCIIGPAGRLVDCRVELESHPGLGARMLDYRSNSNVRLAMGDQAAAAEGRIFYVITTGQRIRRH